MYIVYFSFDEVNRHYAQALAPRGTTVETCRALDELHEQFDVCAYDLDCWQNSVRLELIEQLMAAPVDRPVAVHSYSLDEAQQAALRDNRVHVFRQLTSAIFDALLEEGRLSSIAERAARPSRRLGTLSTQKTVVRKPAPGTSADRDRRKAADRFATSSINSSHSRQSTRDFDWSADNGRKT